MESLDANKFRVSFAYVGMEVLSVIGKSEIKIV